jgi:hypothetical protein
MRTDFPLGLIALLRDRIGLALLMAAWLGGSGALQQPSPVSPYPSAPLGAAMQDWQTPRLPDTSLSEAWEDCDEDESRDSAGLSDVFKPCVFPPNSEAYPSLQGGGPSEWNIEPEAPPPRLS